jgi:hypothetical protein
MIKFKITGQKEEKTEIELEARIDQQGDFCVKHNGCTIFYISSNTGTIQRMECLPILREMLKGFQFNSRGEIRVGDIKGGE